jgi:hypothetical protein
MFETFWKRASMLIRGIVLELGDWFLIITKISLLTVIALGDEQPSGVTSSEVGVYKTQNRYKIRTFKLQKSKPHGDLAPEFSRTLL